ncbi:unnamed protein product [Lampetra fluviatilis]
MSGTLYLLLAVSPPPYFTTQVSGGPLGLGGWAAPDWPPVAMVTRKLLSHWPRRLVPGACLAVAALLWLLHTLGCGLNHAEESAPRVPEAVVGLRREAGLGQHQAELVEQAAQHRGQLQVLRKQLQQLKSELHHRTEQLKTLQGAVVGGASVVVGGASAVVGGASAVVGGASVVGREAAKPLPPRPWMPRARAARRACRLS